jgi:hypothetical protein
MTKIPQTIYCFFVPAHRATDHLAVEIAKGTEHKRIVAVATMVANNKRGESGVMVTAVTEP